MTMDYEQLKDMAREKQCRITDLIALAPQNDPFYVGTSGDWEKGRWFADLWERFGYASGVHLRRVHYRLVSQDPPVMLPNGVPYENTERCWGYLGAASKAARYLGLVDAEDFDDRRNPEPVIYADDAEVDPDLWIASGEVNFWDRRLPQLPDAPDYRLAGFTARQPYMLEVWCEKSTMNDVLIPLCEEYNANLLTALGEFSITAVLASVRRIAADGRPAALLYVSDFDPAGRCMPVSVARKLEYYLGKYAPGADVQLVPIALTEEQCIEYRLPRTPIKETELRRGGFEAQFGTGATELDALEALHSGSLAAIVRDALEAYRDPTLTDRVREVERDLRSEMEATRGAILEEHAAELEEIRQEYEQLGADIGGRLADFHKRREVLWRAISEQLEEQAPDIDAYPVPQPRYGAGLDDPLYSSARDYLEQMSVYKGFQGRASDVLERRWRGTNTEGGEL